MARVNPLRNWAKSKLAMASTFFSFQPYLRDLY